MTMTTENLFPLTAKFYVGQRVKQWDKGEQCNVYGHVTKVFAESVYVLWNDLNDECRHDVPADIETIKDSNDRS